MERGKLSVFLSAPVVIWSFSCISVKLPEPACINLSLPVARGGPPYPVLNAWNRNGIVPGGFPNPNSDSLGGPDTQRSFPAKTSARCCEAVPGLRPGAGCWGYFDNGQF